MSISSVVSRGYGTWSTVNKLPTWGYSIGAVVVVVDGITTRLTLIGTSQQRLTLTGTSQNRLALVGSSH